MAAGSVNAHVLERLPYQGPDITVVDGDGNTPLSILRRRKTMDFSIASRLMPDR